MWQATTHPALARPWTDPLGNTWCAVASSYDDISIYKFFDGTWRYKCASYLWTLHPDLLAGIGRALPPVPALKRVATVVDVPGSGGWRFAAKHDALYMRAENGQWVLLYDINPLPETVRAATEAFAGAGDVLPGEEGSDA